MMNGSTKVLSCCILTLALPLMAAVENGSIALDWRSGGEQPVKTIDFGPQTVGGYAVFTVKGFRCAGKTKEGTPIGFPVLRLSYATHPDGLSPTGDFTRKDCAHYLGMDFDNPVLPANVNRFETYTIARTGTFVAPLLQGQTRYVRVQLDTPGTAVDICSLEIRNVGVHDKTPPAGSFRCSDERVNRTWAMGARTCQMAAIPNHDAWRVVAGRLLPRKLEKSAPAGFCATSRWRGDGTLETAFELRANPHYDSAMGLMLRAADADNGLVVVASQPAFCRVFERRGGANRRLWQAVLPEPLVDGVPHTLAATMKGPVLTVALDGVKVAEVDVGQRQVGDKFGFYAEKEWWPVVSSVTLRDGKGDQTFHDDFSVADAEGRLPGWDYPRAFRFLADGGKRDRLVWSGDLWWAARTCFNVFGPKWPYFRESLRLLAFNQTPEGYSWAAPYAENTRQPASGEYGHFPSDEFSAWFTPCLWEYYLHTADRETANELYPNMRKSIDYLTSHCREDGIFEQRKETSNHANAIGVSDTRHRLYMNLIVWMSYRDGARLARELGHGDDAERWARRQKKLADAMREKFSDPQTGEYSDVLERKGLYHFSRGMALASGFATKDEALSLGRMSPSGMAGKFLLLCLRGKFEYGFAESAFQLLESGTWFELSDPSWAGAQCDTECGFLVRNDWWDESHPDTTASGVMTTYLLGVEPLKPGYRRFRFRPRFVSRLTFAEGSVPTPHGDIRARWDVDGDKAACRLMVPDGTEAEVLLPGVAKTLGPGEHAIEAVGVRAALIDPTISVIDCGGEKAVDVNGYASNVYGNRNAVFEYVVDLGGPHDVRGIELSAGNSKFVPSSVVVETAAEPGKFMRQKELNAVEWDGMAERTLKIDLRTVGGALFARYVRFAFADVPPSWNEDLKTHYRVRLARLRVIYND